MKENRKWVEIWLMENRRQLISCPYQPGNLVIPKTACFRRYRLAQKERDLKGANFRVEYSLCGRCPIGGKIEHPRETVQPAEGL